MKASKPKTESQATTDDAAAVAKGSPMAVGSAAMQAWMDMGNEMVRFVWDRLQQDLKTQQAMLACTSLEEIRQVQAEFFKSAQEQYAAEAQKMLAMMGKATMARVAPTGEARRYDDVPL
ncbi:MAG: phasin family protein [Tabrizicola sp.]|jgi:hypothetical protein|nr:phasin family protein [Tabrizicola sp.]